MADIIASTARAIPAEVLELAEAEGVLAVLEPVLNMTESLFPASKITLEVDEDPEIANDRHILLRAKANLGVAQALEARYQWHRKLFECCPSTHVCVFRLGLELL